MQLDNIKRGVVSILMPVYNEQQFIGEAISSILDQTYPEWELIIVNDASTDCTEEIVQEFGRNDKRIKLYTFKENKGACEALNEALRQASGKYVCWLSADDKYEPEMLESSVDYLEKNERFEAVFSIHKFIDENSNDIETWMPGTAYYDIGKEECDEPYKTLLLIGNGFNACTVVGTRECFDKAGFFSDAHRYAGDYDYMLRLVAYSDIGFLNKVNVLSRVHEGQVTNEGKNDLDAIRVYGEMICNDVLREKLFQKSGLLETREMIFMTCKIRMDIYSGGNREKEIQELEKISVNIARSVKPIVEADAFCEEIVALIEMEEWDAAENMIQRISDEQRKFIDKEKWGIIVASILINRGQYTNAKEALNAVLEMNVRNYEAYYMKGQILESEQEYMNTLENYTNSVIYSEKEDYEFLINNLKRFINEKL